MIYLFEDRKGRMQQYFKEVLDKKYVSEAIIDCEPEKLENYLQENFPDAKCILFHKSYSFPISGLTSDDVKRSFLNKGIPFVYFSGGLKNNLVIENYIQSGTVNSGDMYNNLSLFIDEFASKHIVNIPLLIYGSKYLLNSLLRLQKKINFLIFDKSYNYILNYDDLDEILDEIKSGISENELAEDKVKLVEWIENNINERKLTVDVIKSQIQKLIDKY